VRTYSLDAIAARAIELRDRLHEIMPEKSGAAGDEQAFAAHLGQIV
jgi:hypothetical protein